METNNKNAALAKLIPDKTNFKTKGVRKEKEGPSSSILEYSKKLKTLN